MYLLAILIIPALATPLSQEKLEQLQEKDPAYNTISSKRSHQFAQRLDQTKKHRTVRMSTSSILRS